MNGINYRGHDLFQIIEKCPKAPGGTQPIPEAILWLLLTGEFPNEAEIKDFKDELFKRGSLTK